MIQNGQSHRHGGVSKGQAAGEEERVFYNIQGLMLPDKQKWH